MSTISGKIDRSVELSGLSGVLNKENAKLVLPSDFQGGELIGVLDMGHSRYGCFFKSGLNYNEFNGEEVKTSEQLGSAVVVVSVESLRGLVSEQLEGVEFLDVSTSASNAYVLSSSGVRVYQTQTSSISLVGEFSLPNAKGIGGEAIEFNVGLSIIRNQIEVFGRGKTTNSLYTAVNSLVGLDGEWSYRSGQSLVSGSGVQIKPTYSVDGTIQVPQGVRVEHVKGVREYLVLLYQSSVVKYRASSSGVWKEFGRDNLSGEKRVISSLPATPGEEDLTLPLVKNFKEKGYWVNEWSLLSLS